MKIHKRPDGRRYFLIREGDLNYRCVLFTNFAERKTLRRKHDATRCALEWYNGSSFAEAWPT